MGIKFEGTINLNKLFDKVVSAFFGTLSGKLIFSGTGLFSLGISDFLIFAWETTVLKRNVAAPGSNLGIAEKLGLFLILLGIIVFIVKAFSKSFIGNKTELRNRRVDLLEKYNNYENTYLQYGLWELFRIRNADTATFRRVMDKQPTNRTGAMQLYKNCYFHLELIKDEKLALKGGLFKARYQIGWVLWFIFYPSLIFSCILLAMSEYILPGVSSSGRYAFELYIFLSITVGVAAVLMFRDLLNMGSAITLVKEVES